MSWPRNCQFRYLVRQSMVSGPIHFGGPDMRFWKGEHNLAQAQKLQFLRCRETNTVLQPKGGIYFYELSLI